MADSLAKTVVKARFLAVWHIIVGLFLVSFGIVEHNLKSFIGTIYLGIWTGIWVSRIGSSSNAVFVFVPKVAKTCMRHYIEINP